MKHFLAIATALSVSFVALIPNPSDAAVITATAIGQASYGLHPTEYQNGDFRVVACCAEPNVGDAQEEWTSWNWDLSTAPAYAQFLSVTSLETATLRLVFRTGGDTPADDAILGPFGTAHLFQFTNQFSQYDITLDLISLGYAPSILADIKNTGQLFFQMGNDSSPYYAELIVTGTPTNAAPTAPTVALAGLALLAMYGLRRRQVRKAN